MLTLVEGSFFIHPVERSITDAKEVSHSWVQLSQPLRWARTNPNYDFAHRRKRLRWLYAAEVGLARLERAGRAIKAEKKWSAINWTSKPGPVVGADIAAYHHCNAKTIDTGRDCSKAFTRSSQCKVKEIEVFAIRESITLRTNEDLDFDAANADLLVVIGTSMRVAPVSYLPQVIGAPAVLINREPVTCTFNAELLGDCENVWGNRDGARVERGRDRDRGI
jgi:hypothetical protein